MKEANYLTDQELITVLCDTSDYEQLETWCWKNHTTQFKGRGEKFWGDFLDQAKEENVYTVSRYADIIFARWTNIMDQLMRFYDAQNVPKTNRMDSSWYLYSTKLSRWAIERAKKDQNLLFWLCGNNSLLQKDPILAEELVDCAISLNAINAMRFLCERTLSPIASIKLAQALLEQDMLWDNVSRTLALKKTSPVEVLEILLDNNKDDLWTLRKIGFHPNASVPILETLAVNKDSKVRWGVAKNPNAPQALLEKLKEDKTSSVSQAATQTLKKLGK